VNNVKHYQKLIYNIIFFTHIFVCTSFTARSPHRPHDPLEPKIAVSWHGRKKLKKWILRDSHIEPYPMFEVFNKEFFEQHMLPNDEIVYRNMKNYSVHSEKLSKQIEGFVQELKKGKRKFTNFVLLQDKNFNYRKLCGLIVVRFKKDPFVLKLFMESPKTFIDTHNKGLEPIVVFNMGAGANRHLTGLTRIENLLIVKKRIAKSPKWSKIIDTPRKWFWLPKKAEYIDIEGTNIGNHKMVKTSLPATYAIIADAIESDKRISLLDKKYRKTTMELCNYLELWIDPHIDNFMPEKGTAKIVIVDTEHFPSFVGLKEPVTFSGYLSWYTYLATKCLKSMFFRTKKERREAQTIPHKMALRHKISS